jgi:phosphate starvation-inducible PhoH-like protein
MIDMEKVDKFLERGVIEVAPIAFMRGRTLSDSFIIVDEAQNTTPEQMKMVLTRIGFNSKMVVTGDITQIDLPPGKQSGVVHVLDVLRGVEQCRRRDAPVLAQTRRRWRSGRTAGNPALLTHALRRQ